jgi:glycosyltransferase involved in cell wall biosynthesis
MHPLRIALIAPPWFSVPPAGYGGVEWVVSLLADGLVDRGHDVTLFASGGSCTKAKLVSTYQTPPSADLGDWLVESIAITQAYARWREFDIIHDHTLLGLVAAGAVPVPVVNTVHGEVIPKVASLYREVARHVHFVSISENQRQTLPSECASTVIYNGIDTDRYPFCSRPGSYLLFVGRINRDKGILEAIEIAKRCNRQLIILAKINEAPERAYFEAQVRPALEGLDYEFYEQAPHEVKVAAYRQAFATLFPIQWPEPFGLVMTESMSCGTPVIAFRNGSVPEVIADGKTGFICQSVEEAVRAVERVPSLNREDCRQRVEAYFGAERNVLQHERLYAELLTSRPGLDLPAPARPLPMDVGQTLPASMALPLH